MIKINKKFIELARFLDKEAEKGKLKQKNESKMVLGDRKLFS